MFLGNNDSGAPITSEWTMSRHGGSSIYSAWIVLSSGGVGDYYLTDTVAVRPVFYLSTSVNYVSGSGKSDDPFIIS